MDTKQKNAFWTRRNIAIIAVASIILVAAIGGMTWWIINNNHPTHVEGPATQNDLAKAAAQSKQAAADGKLSDEASQAIKDNKAADADKLYQQAVDAETTAERKTKLYLDLSSVYYAEGRYDDAFAAAKKSDAINPDKFLMADWLSRLYEDRKDYVQAADYYRLAGQSATSSENHTGLDKTYYDSAADRVMKLETGK